MSDAEKAERIAVAVGIYLEQKRQGFAVPKELLAAVTRVINEVTPAPPRPQSIPVLADDDYSNLSPTGLVAGDLHCNETLRKNGVAYPRTCRRCGLGPCNHNQTHQS